MLSRSISCKTYGVEDWFVKIAAMRRDDVMSCVAPSALGKGKKKLVVGSVSPGLTPRAHDGRRFAAESEEHASASRTCKSDGCRGLGVKQVRDTFATHDLSSGCGDRRFEFPIQRMKVGKVLPPATRAGPLGRC